VLHNTLYTSYDKIQIFQTVKTKRYQSKRSAWKERYG